MTWATIQSIFVVAGGFGLFLFGMKMMSDGLENMAGNRMRTILEKATSNPYLGILVGAIVTAIVHSSSAVTIISVGFVNSGLMTLSQSIGVMMGANVGTTITAQMIAFKLDAIAPLCIFIGIIMHMFYKKKSVKNIGYIILGFGILFFGISVMGSPLEEFSKNPAFQSVLTNFENPVLAFFAGLIFTAVIQSSSATTGILVALYLKGVPFPFEAAAFIVLGSNIGTCGDTMLASLAGNREGKQAAMSHVLYNVIGCVFFGALILIFPGILTWIETTWTDGARQIAMFHTLFNVASIVIFLPFIKQFTALVKLVIPDEVIANQDYSKKLLYLGDSVAQTPDTAVSAAHQELCRMGRLVVDNLTVALEAFNTKDEKKANTVLETEEIINFLNHQITSWIVQLRGLDLSDSDLEKMNIMLRIVSAVERIGDHAENISEFALLEEEQATAFSPSALEELNRLSTKVLEAVILALDIFDRVDEKKLPEIERLKQEVSDLAKECIENHIERLKNQMCDPYGGVVFSDMVSELEGCCNHAINTAYLSLGRLTVGA